MDDLTLKLIDFIILERGKYNFPIVEETRLQDDLGIYGDDAVEFLFSYGKKFNVDISKFDFNSYFKPEGLDFFGNLRNLIKRGKLKEYKDLRVIDLAKGIKLGILS